MQADLICSLLDSYSQPKKVQMKNEHRKSDNSNRVTQLRPCSDIFYFINLSPFFNFLKRFSLLKKKAMPNQQVAIKP